MKPIKEFKGKRLSPGTRVSWMQENQMIPHPEGKTCRKGETLSVMRTIRLYGTIRHTNVIGYEVSVDNRRYSMSVPYQSIKIERASDTDAQAQAGYEKLKDINQW